MNAVMLSRMLGWFSLAMGSAEAIIPLAAARSLGLTGKGWLVRAFGFREIASGITVLAKPDQAAGPVLRVVGDVLDLAVLAPALSRRNKRQPAAQVAFAMVLGVMALDVLCAAALIQGEQGRAATAARARLRQPRQVSGTAAKPRPPLSRKRSRKRSRSRSMSTSRISASGQGE